jgi:hypothetical protein
MPGLAPGIHVSLCAGSQAVDGRDKPGHDDAEAAAPLWTFGIFDSPFPAGAKKATGPMTT